MERGPFLSLRELRTAHGPGAFVAVQCCSGPGLHFGEAAVADCSSRYQSLCRTNCLQKHMLNRFWDAACGVRPGPRGPLVCGTRH